MKPLRSILYEANGTGSFSRTIGLIITINVLGWAWYIVIKTGSLPDLVALAAFEMGTAGVFYGINRGTAPLQPKENNNANS